MVRTGVGVEKVDIHKNGVILGDRKCLGDPRKSFVGHSDATQFGTSSSRRVFQQPLAQSHTEHSRNTAEPNLPDYGQSGNNPVAHEESDCRHLRLQFR